MKNQLLFTLVLVFTVVFSGFSQKIYETPLDEIDAEYVEMRIIPQLNSKVWVRVDYGQKAKLLDFGSESLIRDKFDDPMEFNSSIAALNFMSSRGYEFVQAFKASENDTRSLIYLLRKEKE